MTEQDIERLLTIERLAKAYFATRWPDPELADELIDPQVPRHYRVTWHFHKWSVWGSPHHPGGDISPHCTVQIKTCWVCSKAKSRVVVR